MIVLDSLRNRIRGKNSLLGLFISFVALAVYSGSLGNGFVTDDPGVILQNPVMRGEPLSLFSVIDTASDTQLLPFYRPLTYLTFYVEGRLHGFNPLYMHMLNVILHAACSFLVFMLARSLFSAPWPALFAGLLFAVHPLNTESVNFIAGGRNTMLACFFVVAAYLVHLRSIEKDSSLTAFGGGVLFLAGLLSKESAMMGLPFFAFQEMIRSRKKGSGMLLHAFMRLVPYAAVTIFYLVIRWKTLSRFGIQTGIVPGMVSRKLEDMYIFPSLAERLMNNIYIIPKYLLTVIWPTSLSPRYTVPGDFHLIALPLIAGWICIICVVVWLIKRGRGPATFFGLSWMVAFWLPVSGIFPISSIHMADRYFYLPAIGLWLIAADQADRFAGAGRTTLRYVTGVSVAVLVFMAVLTVRRNPDWKSDLTLFTRMVEQYPDNPAGYFHLGAAYLARKGPNDLLVAEKNLKMALALDPSNQSVQTPLGQVRLEMGDFEGALHYYSEALGFYPLDRAARINRADVYVKLGRYREALADYQFYLKIPGHDDIPGALEHAEAKVVELSRY